MCLSDLSNIEAKNRLYRHPVYGIKKFRSIFNRLLDTVTNNKLTFFNKIFYNILKINEK